MTGTAVIIPQNIQLPAHLQASAELVAKYNAAAGGGIKTGGFPRISIAGSKFFIVESGEKKLITDPKNPALPLMQLEMVVIGANSRLSKVLYEDDFQPGDDKEPLCSSDDGIKPDMHLASPVFHSCATCPKNQWGSKISKASGKEVKACSDVKRLAMIPATPDMAYKALGFTITPSSLGDWGKYVKALSERNIPVTAVVTNITFDATVSYPKVNFAFGRFLSPEEFALVQKRSDGEDVQAIVSPRAGAVPALPAPAQQAPVQQVTQQAAAATVAGFAPAAPVQAAMEQAATATVAGFGTAPAQPVLVQPNPEPAVPKKARKTRAPAAVDEAAAAAAQAAVAQIGNQVAETAATTSVAAQVAAQTIDPLGHLPPAIRAAVEAVGVTSVAGQAIMASYPAPAAAPAQVAAPVQPAVVAPPVQAAVQQAAAATVAGFGTTPVTNVAPAAPPVTPAVTAAAGGLAGLLKAKLQAGRPAQ